MSEEKVELVFVPSIGLSHLIPTAQFAKLLLNHDHSFNVTFFLIPPLHAVARLQDYIDSVTNSVPNIRFISLPQADLPPPTTEPGIPYILTYLQNYQPVVKQAITQHFTSDSTSLDSVRLVLDMFTASMVDIAKELNVPSYLYFTSGACFLGLWFLVPSLDSEIATEFKDHSPELLLPCYVNPVPTLSLLSIFSHKKATDFKLFISLVLWFKQTNGIIVNSFPELESQAFHAFTSLMEGVPRVYPVGPLLDLDGNSHSGNNQQEEKYDQIMKWLDDQPESSVVFLCFGTRGSMSAPQVTHIANGLEQSGHRFLWSLRRPAASPMETPTDYTDPQEVLPDGFLDRIGDRSLVCGWVSQKEVLAHKATGAFVSHCGWNSILEGVWFAVPIVAWPLHAEQKMNAFQLVKDLGVAVEIREGYHREDGNNDLVEAEDVERGVKCIMEDDSKVRSNMKEVSVKCRDALMEGGSSLSNLRFLVENLIKWK